jgi:hypothetical protein
MPRNRADFTWIIDHGCVSTHPIREELKRKEGPGWVRVGYAVQPAQLRMSEDAHKLTMTCSSRIISIADVLSTLDVFYCEVWLPYPYGFDRADRRVAPGEPRGQCQASGRCHSRAAGTRAHPTLHRTGTSEGARREVRVHLLATEDGIRQALGRPPRRTKRRGAFPRPGQRSASAP